MIFKLLYTSIYYIFAITSKHSKLTRMETKANITRTGQVTHSRKFSGAIFPYIVLPPKPAPTMLSVYRQYITTKSYHSKIFI